MLLSKFGQRLGLASASGRGFAHVAHLSQRASVSSERGGPRARRPGTEAGDVTRVNTQDHGRKNQPVTEGEGHSSSSGCREGTGMGTETPGFRGFELGPN